MNPSWTSGTSRKTQTLNDWWCAKMDFSCLVCGAWGGVSHQGGNRFSFVLQNITSKILFLGGSEKWGCIRMQDAVLSFVWAGLGTAMCPCPVQLENETVTMGCKDVLSERLLLPGQALHNNSCIVTWSRILEEKWFCPEMAGAAWDFFFLLCLGWG